MKEYQDGDENQITPTQEQNIHIRENSDQAPHKKSTIPNIDEAILIAPILSALDGVKGLWGEDNYGISSNSESHYDFYAHPALLRK